MSTPHFRKKLDFYQKTEYNKNAKSVKKRRTVSSLKKGGDTNEYIRDVWKPICIYADFADVNGSCYRYHNSYYCNYQIKQ